MEEKMLWKSDRFEEGGGLGLAGQSPLRLNDNKSGVNKHRSEAHNGVILIADDNPDDAYHAKVIVEKLFAPPPVRVLQSGDEVIAYLERRGQFENPDSSPYPVLLLLDLLMPGTDGFAVLRWLQAHPEHHKLPVIVLSVVREFREISKAYQLGARSFLMKPMALNEIRMALHALEILPDADLYPGGVDPTAAGTEEAAKSASSTSELEAAPGKNTPKRAPRKEKTRAKTAEPLETAGVKQK